MSENCDFYFWRLQFEVPFRHFDKMKAFPQICLQPTFHESVRIAFFASDLVFFTPEQNMALNGGRFCTCLCHSALEIAPCFLLFTSIRHFAICWWQNSCFDQKLHTFRRDVSTNFTRKALARHQSTFQTSRVAFANSTREVLKTLTSSQQNRREKRSFSTLFGVCNFWHSDSISYILSYITTLEA